MAMMIYGNDDENIWDNDDDIWDNDDGCGDADDDDDYDDNGGGNDGDDDSKIETHVCKAVPILSMQEYDYTETFYY